MQATDKHRAAHQGVRACLLGSYRTTPSAPRGFDPRRQQSFCINKTNAKFWLVWIIGHKKEAQALGFDKSGAESIDTDSFDAEFASHRSSQLKHSRLASLIRDPTLVLSNTSHMRFRAIYTAGETHLYRSGTAYTRCHDDASWDA